MEQIIQYMIENRLAILAILGAINMFATTVAKLTPTQTDNNLIEKVRKFCEYLGNMFLPDIKQK